VVACNSKKRSKSSSFSDSDSGHENITQYEKETKIRIAKNAVILDEMITTKFGADAVGKHPEVLEKLSEENMLKAIDEKLAKGEKGKISFTIGSLGGALGLPTTFDSPLSGGVDKKWLMDKLKTIGKSSKRCVAALKVRVPQNAKVLFAQACVYVCGEHESCLHAKRVII
jgi:hypothetical protein